ncbi:50S ribosomal protein L22 [Natronobacterium gregoryi]|uniref:Large ribosomal subunit protein uL22 n=2 Tax=Natronobacterium gregoryi TaxID=44930 RepID=L0ACE2_NATGS|nr:50S ribosomal protein L22 [Natronobacterium gregoryi]AFZ71568.1 ribosomal protein L22/L17 [Natronobacterium gregoryi SP2]ELY66625.1 50S ribosomal protein L22P [Natronobacterium gregoryi SP2]PLK21337.1 50S ribosomal protein L22 [Natronobacterium gregoryi SP2]SFI81512.1 large subunit ribosomal protein L22 [Natronobacterium gregoryi]
MGINYSVDADPDATAKAMLRERQMSHKHSKEVAREIKGRTVGEARAYLQDVIDETQSVPFKSHNSGVGHRSDIDGWDAGRYPEKVSGAFLDLLENVEANADHQGFDGESMEIAHVAAHKVGESVGRKPRAMGRASAWNSPEVDVEIVVEETDSDSEDDDEEGDN